MAQLGPLNCPSELHKIEAWFSDLNNLQALDDHTIFLGVLANFLSYSQILSFHGFHLLLLKCMSNVKEKSKTTVKTSCSIENLRKCGMVRKNNSVIKEAWDKTYTLALAIWMNWWKSNMTWNFSEDKDAIHYCNIYWINLHFELVWKFEILIYFVNVERVRLSL